MVDFIISINNDYPCIIMDEWSQPSEDDKKKIKQLEHRLAIAKARKEKHLIISLTKEIFKLQRGY